MENAKVGSGRLENRKSVDTRLELQERPNRERKASEVRPVVVKLTQKVDEPRRKLLRTLIHVAWLAILLGIIMQLLLVAIRWGAFGSVETYVAELTNKIAWAFLVCTGLAVGGAIADEKELALGLSGLITAPVAFIVARGLHKATADLLATTAPTNDALVWVMAGVRGIEYMLLGLLIKWLSGKSWAGAPAHLVTGLTVGLVFGAVGMALTPSALSSLTGVLSWAVNELLFPIGCSLTLFAARAVSNKLVVDKPSRNLRPAVG